MKAYWRFWHHFRMLWAVATRFNAARVKGNTHGARGSPMDGPPQILVPVRHPR